MNDSDLILRSAYWDDPGAKRAFKQFILEIHGLDFSEWEAAGYWDDAYTPFSFFKGDCIVASVCIYLLDAIIDGKKKRLAQISGVGTHPQWRRKGMNRRLTQIALDWAQGRHAGVFLFADHDAVPFYERCGFQAMGEYVERTQAAYVPRSSGMVKLDCGSKHELDRIHDYARRRTPVSNRFSILNDRLLMFHVLYQLRHCTFEIPDLGCIVFLTRDAGCLKVLDIVGDRIPKLNDLYPFIAHESDRAIEFHFHTDKLGNIETRALPLLGNNCFVQRGFPVERPVFPFTSRA